MYHFPCISCGLTINTAEPAGHSAICPNCNTRQTVPPHAVRLTPPEEQALAGSPAAGGSANNARGDSSAVSNPTPQMPPDYAFLRIAGYILMIAGPVAGVASLCAPMSVTQIAAQGFAITDSQTRALRVLSTAGGLLNGVIACFLLLGLGQLLHAVRDIARNSWLGTS